MPIHAVQSIRRVESTERHADNGQELVSTLTKGLAVNDVRST